MLYETSFGISQKKQQINQYIKVNSDNCKKDKDRNELFISDTVTTAEA